MSLCRSIAEVEAAADADSLGEPPLTQAQADRVAAILHPVRTVTREHAGRVRGHIADALTDTAREASTP